MILLGFAAPEKGTLLQVLCTGIETLTQLTRRFHLYLYPYHIRRNSDASIIHGPPLHRMQSLVMWFRPAPLLMCFSVFIFFPILDIPSEKHDDVHYICV